MLPSRADGSIRSKKGGISVTEAEKRARDLLAKAGVPTQAEVLHGLKAVPVQLTDTRKFPRILPFRGAAEHPFACRPCPARLLSREQCTKNLKVLIPNGDQAKSWFREGFQSQSGKTYEAGCWFDGCSRRPALFSSTMIKAQLARTEAFAHSVSCAARRGPHHTRTSTS